jgi:hypothetical protein
MSRALANLRRPRFCQFLKFLKVQLQETILFFQSYNLIIFVPQNCLKLLIFSLHLIVLFDIDDLLIILFLLNGHSFLAFESSYSLVAEFGSFLADAIRFGGRLGHRFFDA